MNVSAVIPAHDEEGRIAGVVEELSDLVDEVLVVDDGSSDDTVAEAEDAGAEVLIHEENIGYLSALETGFEAAEGDVIVTLDADGEMDPEYIPALLEPIERTRRTW